MVPVPASTGPPGYNIGRRFQRVLNLVHVSTAVRSPDMAKMDPNAADMALAVWNGYVQDARRHAGQWRPVERFSSIAMMWVS